MNYQFHYNKLMERAPKKKPTSGYYERHRIIPGCLGGKYVIGNIAWLTPEEHFIAHQLLVKIYPGNKKLVYSARMMTVNRKEYQARTNKEYAWLKRVWIATIKNDVARNLKLSQLMKGNKRGIGNKNALGRTWSLTEETKAKQRKPKSPEHIAALTKARRKRMK